MTRNHLVLFALASGCFQSQFEGDGGIRLGRYVDGGQANLRCRTYGSPGVGEVCVEVAVTETCGGAKCQSGEECCLTTERCVPVGDMASCPRLPTTWRYDPAPRACSTRSDCGADEFCMPDSFTCAGPGHCQSILACGSCGPPGAFGCEVCGCDGVTYLSSQHACVAGVAIPSLAGGCGKPVRSRPDLISCGNDAQCPSDTRCCMRTRFCFPVAEPWRCETDFNCDDDQECVDRATGQGGGPGSEFFCRRDSCAQQPGSCSGSTSLAAQCGGEVETVCGCDGNTYVNRCWATAARTNVVSTGACP